MHVPILKQENCLIASIQGALNDDELLALRDQLIQQVKQFRSHGVLIDLTVLDVLDSFAARTLRSIAQMSTLLGAQTVIAGIQPDVAMSMVQLGLTLDNAIIAMDLEDGLAILQAHRLNRHDPDIDG